jgi:hypothetical protein
MLGVDESVSFEVACGATPEIVLPSLFTADAAKTGEAIQRDRHSHGADAPSSAIAPPDEELRCKAEFYW